MQGLLYKECFLLKSGLIFAAICQMFISGICVFLAMSRLNMELTVILMAACFYLSSLILSLVNQQLFVQDENRPWSVFVSSTPQNATGQVACKYYMILIENLLLLLCWYLTDIIVVCVTSDTESSAMIAGLLIFCIRILMYAVEIPFIMRFGSGVGSAVKGAAAAVFILIVLCYFMFGDISFLFGEDPIAAFYEFVSSGNVIWIAAVIPYAAAGVYYLSYCISVKLYKEADYSE